MTGNEHVDGVVTAFAEHFHVTPEAVVSDDRTPDATTARHLSMLVCWRVLGLSLTELGVLFGRKHNGVKYGAVRASRLLVSDPHVYKVALDVLTSLGLPRQDLPVLSPGSARASEGGLVAVHGNTYSELSFFNSLPQAGCVDMALTTGTHLIEALKPRLKEAICNGCAVRLTLTDPESDYVKSPPSHAFCDGPTMRDLLEWTFLELHSLKRSLVHAGAPGSLVVKLRSSAPTCNLILLDRALARWTPLLPFQDTKGSPSLDFANVEGSIYPTLEDTFEKIWDEVPLPNPEYSYNPAIPE